MVALALSASSMMLKAPSPPPERQPPQPRPALYGWLSTGPWRSSCPKQPIDLSTSSAHPERRPHPEGVRQAGGPRARSAGHVVELSPAVAAECVVAEGPSGRVVRQNGWIRARQAS